MFRSTFGASFRLELESTRKENVYHYSVTPDVTFYSSFKRPTTICVFAMLHSYMLWRTRLQDVLRFIDGEKIHDTQLPCNVAR